MSRIPRALMRRFGPLPAWAWLTILGGALLVYRRYAGGGKDNSAAGAPFQAPPLDPGAKRDPVVLSPGESVYDPETGKLYGDPPGGGGTGDAPPPRDEALPPGEPGGITKRTKVKHRRGGGALRHLHPRRPVRKKKGATHRAGHAKAVQHAHGRSRGLVHKPTPKPKQHQRPKPKTKVWSRFREHPEPTHHTHAATQTVRHKPKPHKVRHRR